jgi:hypothetical protein
MAFGNIGQLIAGTAIEATKKNVIDAITGPDPSKTPEKAPVAAPAESVGGLILGQLQAMQRPLKDDQEMAVFYQAGTETLRVLEIFVPNLQVFVLAGTDWEQNVTRVVVPAEHAVLTCKIRKVAEGSRPVRVNVLSPRPKTDAPA